MTAAELREAQQAWDEFEREYARLNVGFDTVILPPILVAHARAAFDAARTIALPILEADPELVKRVRLALLRYHRITTSNIHAATDEILAAISTEIVAE